MIKLVLETRKLCRLAAPVAATQIGVILMGLVDTMMVGGLGQEALSAVALGGLWVFGGTVIGMGFIMGMDPLVAQAHGARDERRLGHTLQQGIVLAAVLSVPLALSWLVADPGLRLLKQDPALTAVAQEYCDAQLFAAPAILFFTTFRQYLQGRAIVMPALIVTLFANVFNALANWVLIYGKLGLPALDVAGAGLATGLTKVVMLVGLGLWILRGRLHRGAWTPWTRAVLRWREYTRLVTLGAPVAAQFGLEVWAFQAVALFAGRLGAAELAAHTIVLRVATTAFMIPYGIAQAATTRVGNLIGAGQRSDAQRSAWLAMALGAAVMVVSAIAFTVGRHLLPGLFISDPVVEHLAATIFPIAAAFQIFDGAQVVGAGILRGNGDTRPAALFTLIGFYLFALPCAYGLVFVLDHGLTGLWWGLCLGLGADSLLVLWWVWRRGPARNIIEL